jgi:hypothetical protein
MWADYYEKYAGKPKFGSKEDNKLAHQERLNAMREATAMRMLAARTAAAEATAETEGYADEASVPKTMGGLPLESIRSGKGGRIIPQYKAQVDLFGMGDVTSSPNDTSTGDEFLQKNVPVRYHDTVKNIANMKIAGKDIGLYKNPTMRTQIDSWGMRYRPEFNPQNVESFQKMKSDYTTGEPAKAIRSLNTSLMHMGTFHKQMLDIHDKNKAVGNMPLINQLVLRTQAAFGKGDLAEVSKTTKVLANEVPKALRGSGVVAEQDIQDWQKEFGAAQSPEQVERGLESATELLGGQLQSRTGFYRETAKRLGVPEDQQDLPDDLSVFPETEESLRQAKLTNLIGKLKGVKGTARGSVDDNDPMGLR